MNRRDFIKASIAAAGGAGALAKAHAEQRTSGFSQVGVIGEKPTVTYATEEAFFFVDSDEIYSHDGTTWMRLK